MRSMPWFLVVLLGLATAAGCGGTHAKRRRDQSPESPEVAAARAAKEAKREAKAFRKLEVDGAEVIRGVERLTAELRWHRSLETAVPEAQVTGRPIVMVAALGELDGFL